MSAIFGAVSLGDREIPKEHIECLKNSFSRCKIDRYEYIEEKKLFMGCGLQYFTMEAQFEKLPSVSGYSFFDADVIIDNRKELLDKLNMDSNGCIPDGELLLSMLNRYGADCLTDCVGAFSFVMYDRKTNTITIGADSVGYRFVYYLLQDGILYYSSLLNPLEAIIKERSPNKRWLADFIGQDNLNMFTECEETPIQGIYRIAPAHYLTISNGGIIKKQYWSVYKKTDRYRCKNDSQYRECFLRLYTECVECLLRSPKETAILLSGGYDSTSVAVLAAPMLKKFGKKLYSFTSVPFKDYKTDFGDAVMVDETEAVLKTKEKLDNLECTFMDMPDMNCWYDRKDYTAICELPYKSPQNLLWMYEGMKEAGQKNARIMLGGMFGNGTVSFDNARLYFAGLFRRGRFITLYKEVKALNQRQHYTKKSVIITAARDALGIGRRKKTTTEELFCNSYAKQEVLRQTGADSRIYSMQHRLEKSMNSVKQYHKEMITPDILRHYGEFAQKNSLYTGVIIRDPTRDKRIIEFVMNAPQYVFTHNGYTRRLITDYMKELMPEHIIRERRIGRQSADLKARILKDGEKIKAEWLSNYSKYSDNCWIDCIKAASQLKDKNISDMTDFEIVRHIYTNIFLEYLDGKGFLKG